VKKEEEFISIEKLTDEIQFREFMNEQKLFLMKDFIESYHSDDFTSYCRRIWEKICKK